MAGQVARGLLGYGATAEPVPAGDGPPAMGHAERAAALFKESIGLYEEMESRRVDGAVPGVFAADWMTIQIYRREAESLFTPSESTPGPAR